MQTEESDYFRVIISEDKNFDASNEFGLRKTQRRSVFCPRIIVELYETYTAAAGVRARSSFSLVLS